MHKGGGKGGGKGAGKGAGTGAGFGLNDTDWAAWSGGASDQWCGGAWGQ